MPDNLNNSKKHLMMLCYHFAPRNGVASLRSRKFVKYLPDYGWNCHVITANRSKSAETNFQKAVRIHFIWNFDFDRFISVSIKIFSTLKNNIFKKLFTGKSYSGRADSIIAVGGRGVATELRRWFMLPDSQFLWILFAFPKSLWVSRRCDLIYSSAWPPSAHVLALLIHKFTKKPWVADFRDEWTLNINWNPATRFHKWLGKKLDTVCVNNANVIVNVTELRSSMFRKHFGGETDKYITIENGYDEEDLQCFRNIEPNEHKLTITSLGSLYGGRDIKPFLYALKSTIEKGTVKSSLIAVKLVGAQNYSLQNTIDCLNLSDVVEILPKLPQQKAFMILAKSNVALLIGSVMEKIAMTTKVYEYAGMGKPILALVPEGPVSNFVDELCGWSVNFDKKNEISMILEKIVYLFENRKMHFIPATRIEQYERRLLTKKLVDCFNKCYS